MKRKRKDKKSNIVDAPSKEFTSYKNGAFIGALIGGLSAIIIGKRIVFFTLGGAVAGGFIAYKLAQDDSSTTSGIKNFRDKV